MNATTELRSELSALNANTDRLRAKLDALPPNRVRHSATRLAALLRELEWGDTRLPYPTAWPNREAVKSALAQFDKLNP